MDTITLKGVAPKVFVGDDQWEKRPSDVWRTDLTLSRPGRYLIEAESGAGKSSLCAFIYGWRHDYEGVISFDGKDIRSLSHAEWVELRRRHLAYLPQDMLLFSELTARQNVAVKNDLTGCLTPARIDDMLRQLGLDDRLDTPASRLSVGQQQRVAIVRALAQPFDAILLDEPVSHLDHYHNRLAAALIAEEAARHGAMIVATSVGNPLLLDNARSIKL